MAAHAVALGRGRGGAETRRPGGAEDGQIGLYGAHPPPRRPPALCAGCHAREARYGFRRADASERPGTLCFECFRMELDWRRRAAAHLARGWNAEQARLPLADRLTGIDLRRRRAQIAARHELERETSS